MAPGGPLEKQIQQLQMGAAAEGESVGSVSDIMSGGSQILPEKALKELKRFYGFDKPIWQRYMMWLGVWPREIKKEISYFGKISLKSKNELAKKQEKYSGWISVGRARI